MLYVCGSDEHGVPITIKAQKEGCTPQDIVDRYHKIIKDSFTGLGINFDIYSRTSSATHHKNAADFFKKLHDEGTQIYVLTASPHSVTEACLKHNDLHGKFRWFEQIWSVEDFKMSKSSPDIFYEVAKTIGCEPREIHYFDDSLIALKNARAAGYITYGVYDAQTPDEVETMKALSDTVVMSFEEM